MTTSILAYIFTLCILLLHACAKDAIEKFVGRFNIFATWIDNKSSYLHVEYFIQLIYWDPVDMCSTLTAEHVKMYRLYTYPCSALLIDSLCDMNDHIIYHETFSR